MKMNSFDVDPKRLPNGYVSLGEPELERTLGGLRKCGLLDQVLVRRSASGNGFHVVAFCRDGECSESCRLCLDSPRRVDLDGLDPEWTRGVLWDSKTYSQGGKSIRLEAGEWTSSPI